MKGGISQFGGPMRPGFRFIPFLILCLFISFTQAFCWEFSLTGNYRWEYYLYSKIGNASFFGPFDTDNSDNPAGYGGTRGSAASMNSWLGNQIGQLSSGSDLAVTYFYMTLEPEFRINPAMRVRGSYRIASWATPDAPTSPGLLVRPRYPEGLSPGINRSFSPGYWNTLWLSVQNPWGIIVAGKRPAPFGMGLMFDAEDNSDAVGVLLMIPYGPFRFGINTVPWSISPSYLAYYSLTDKNSQRPVDIGGGMTYDSASLSVGIGVRYFEFRTGPESASFQGVDDPIAPTGRFAVVPTETTATDGSIYLKYNNGKFFLNAETAWLVGTVRNQRWLSSSSGIIEGGRSRFAPSYLDHWRYAAEAGFVSGPSKLAFLWAWVPGPDRRHGIRIDRQADIRFISAFSNVTLFRPYSLLLSYTYGGGNNSFTADSANGYMTDAHALGVRLDYAVASNLNIFATLFHAERISHGYGWGFVRPDYLTTAPQPRFSGVVQYLESDQYTSAAPSIPDTDLGYECDFGLGWKLLEGYTLSGTFGIWKPGKWFSYACIDRSVDGWKTPNPMNSFGINPERKIDPVFGMEVVMSADF